MNTANSFWRRYFFAIIMQMAIFALAPTAFADSFRPANGMASGTDITGARFNVVSSRAEAFFNSKFEDLRDVKVLFVPGILSTQIIELGRISGGWMHMGEYFDEQIAFLRNSGIDAERLDMLSTSAPILNAKIITSAIDASSKPVVFVTHSKGGIDLLETLIAFPRLQQKVRGWVALQVPFFGSPVADYIDNDHILNPLSAVIIDIIGGTRNVFKELSVAPRTAYLRQNAAKIQALINVIPVLSFTSWKQRELYNPFDTPLAWTRNAMEAAGILNDGLIPKTSAVMPGSRFVALASTDHLVPVMYSSFSEFDRIELTKTLLVLALEKNQ